MNSKLHYPYPYTSAERLYTLGLNAYLAKDIEGAIKYFTRAMRLGCGNSCYQSSLIRKKEVAQDSLNDNYLLQRAAMLGSLEAMNKLGEHYQDNSHCITSKKKGYLWLLKAAKKGSSKAMINLAYSYRDGVGTAVDYQQALHWVNQLPAMHHVWLKSNSTYSDTMAEFERLALKRSIIIRKTWQKIWTFIFKAKRTN
ncbi:tetratricopeptide repeat protein [Aliivibrio fischeri]|uniref:tetratricopeptide repeat protein n=1 Tax=Aliivibrio fischeri TaxID=668 RepID=UPI000AF928EA|nr:SEL1-like repeat protein [Aliivibrio fischeri]